jgi:hypothetical protein
LAKAADSSDDDDLMPVSLALQLQGPMLHRLGVDVLAGRRIQAHQDLAGRPKTAS